MATHHPLAPQAPWRQLTVDAKDWQQADPALLSNMLTQLHWIRAFEEAVLELAAEGLVHGPAHSSVGQEGGAVGSVLALGAGDQINGSHRGHHQFLAKALQHVAPQGWTRATRSTPPSTKCCNARWPRSWAWRRAIAEAVAAPCTCAGSKPARWAPTPSSAAACRWPPARAGRTSTPAPTAWP